MFQRRNSRVIRVGNVAVGGGNPVSIQSMANTDTRDAASTLAQIRQLYELGCEIVRLAVPDLEAARALAEIRAESPVPLVADIHFDYRLALAAMESNVDAVRLNPGNLGEGLELVAAEAVKRDIPIRVGANSGSVRPALLHKFQSQGMNRDEAMAEALVESALEQCRCHQGGVEILQRPGDGRGIPQIRRPDGLSAAHRRDRGGDSGTRHRKVGSRNRDAAHGGNR